MSKAKAIFFSLAASTLLAMAPLPSGASVGAAAVEILFEGFDGASGLEDADIVEFAINDVESTTDYRVIPMCWYVGEWFDEHPDSILTVGGPLIMMTTVLWLAARQLMKELPPGFEWPTYARSGVTGVCGTIAFTRSSYTVTRIAVAAPKLWPTTPSCEMSITPSSRSPAGSRDSRFTR